LRLGLFQLLFLGGVADHAAVNETVELAKRASRGGAGLVNAVLRRATAERDSLLQGLDDDTPVRAAVLHSVPQWLAELWWTELGGGAGSVMAVERHPGRAQALARTCARMGAACVEVMVGDAVTSPPAWGQEEFDRVLVDPPCSGLGTLQSRPDLRWHAGERSI